MVLPSEFLQNITYFSHIQHFQWYIMFLFEVVIYKSAMTNAETLYSLSVTTFSKCQDFGSTWNVVDTVFLLVDAHCHLESYFQA